MSEDVLNVKVISAEQANSLELQIQRWLSQNPNVKIQSVTQSTASHKDSDGNWQIITVTILFLS